ncbi:MAG: type II-A CRISPR-associated protein Csn2 [Atopobiaceae bacterium]
MILAFEGFEKSIELPNGQATTVEINNRKLFARVAQSLVGGAEEPLEPFTLWKDDVEVKPSAVFYYLSDPIHLPYRDSKFEGLMLDSIQDALHRNVDAYIELESLIERVKRIIEAETLALNADYSLAISLDMPKLLKSLGFCADVGEERSLLDNLIQFEASAQCVN